MLPGLHPGEAWPGGRPLPASSGGAGNRLRRRAVISVFTSNAEKLLCHMNRTARAICRPAISRRATRGWDSLAARPRRLCRLSAARAREWCCCLAQSSLPSSLASLLSAGRAKRLLSSLNPRPLQPARILRLVQIRPAIRPVPSRVSSPWCRLNRRLPGLRLPELHLQSLNRLCRPQTEPQTDLFFKASGAAPHWLQTDLMVAQPVAARPFCRDEAR